MNPSRPFILRPVATSLLMVAVMLAGMVAYRLLPLSALPQVDYPTIQVQTFYPGASPEVMTSAVTAPLERQFGQMPGLVQMSSGSSAGASVITLQFSLDLTLDVAEQEVQAAINAADNLLPSDLPAPPIYAKVNPADAPVLTLAVTSATLPLTRVQDLADTRLAQKISQLPGVGLVTLSGGQRSAVRVRANPRALAAYNLNLDDLRTTVANANVNTPKGSFDGPSRAYTINANDQLKSPAEYSNIVIAYRNGAPVRLADVAEVVEGPENTRLAAWAGPDPAIIVNVQRQPGANVIKVVDNIQAMLPTIRATLPAALEVSVLSDRTTTIRASVADARFEMLLAVALVVVVIYLFLGDVRATIIPSLSVPLSLVGTFAVMYLLGYSLNNLSLMALTIATGFVVDDAIVVLENTVRHLEAGKSRLRAALDGAREVSFTVLSMSLSLIAVFIPILLMGGIVGRLFREFAVTLSVAILVSLAVSLATTPMMCSRLLTRQRVAAGGGGWFALLRRGYEWSLAVALRHPALTMLALLATVVLNVHLFAVVPKGFFPQQDTGRIMGGIQADQSISFQAMRGKLAAFVGIVKDDPAVETVVGFTGGSQTNSGFTFVSLKPLAERDASADQVIARLRAKLGSIPGASMFLQSVQDIRAGGRPGNAQYQYTLQSDSLEDLREWTPKLADALGREPAVADVNTDQQISGLEVNVVIDRDAAARLGLTARQIDNTLYDAFGQRQVSTIYMARNQYHVIMELAPQFWQSPETLRDVWISTSGGAVSGTEATAATVAASQTARNQSANQLGSASGTTSTGTAVSTSAETMVPLSAVARVEEGTTALGVNHQGHFAAATLSFNLPVGRSLGDAVEAIRAAGDRIGMPSSVHGSFEGTARIFRESMGNQLLLVLVALAAVYIVLGILYESVVHPVTILSTLPSAGVGAVLALMVFGSEFSLIALIGILLLIGIVKKNAIMMIDFALDAERRQGLAPRDAIFQACVQRFRPIMMTTVVALLGALPLAFGQGEGAEIRRPLGIAIAGGLIVSQVLTLYTTPVVYLYLDRFRLWLGRGRRQGGAPSVEERG